MRISFSFEISFGILDKLQDKGAEFKRRVGEKFLYHDGSGFDVVDEDELPEDLNKDSGKSRGSSGWTWKKEEKKKKQKSSDFHPGKTDGRQFRQHVYDGSSDSKIAQRAAENHYIMQDVLSDPSLVGASSETEAVAKVASEDPGWAKMSDLVDAYDIDVDADGDIDTGTSTSSGEASTGLAEAASDAASFDGDVSTADSADLGPTGPSGYSTGNTGSGSGGDVGGDAGGGDVGGGDL
jgi:hypothetical protein